jgi:hypothetical protein
VDGALWVAGAIAIKTVLTATAAAFGMFSIDAPAKKIPLRTYRIGTLWKQPKIFRHNRIKAAQA